jgi:transposase
MRVIGMDIHRTFAEVVFWEAGQLRPAGADRHDPLGA